MKYVAIVLLFLGAFLCVSESQFTFNVREARDGLLMRAAFITTLVSGEIKLLKVEGNTLQAEGLLLEMEQLVTLELELRATALENITDAFISRLNFALSTIEDRISANLAAVGRLFYSRQEVNELVRRTNDIILRVSETVQRLKIANRTIEAAALESYEIRLIQLELALRSATQPEEIRTLEELLVETDYLVSEILNGVDKTSRKKRDLREDVLKRADELIALANTAIQALTAQGRTNAADLIQRSERNLQLVAADLKNVTSAAEIGRLEGELIGLEYTLVEDLQTVGRPVDIQEYLKLLVTSAEGLREWATIEIQALRNATIVRAEEISLIESEERIIAGILDELQNATSANMTALRRIEQRLDDAEIRLFNHLSRLATPEAYRRRLTRQAEELAVRIMAEIRTLTMQFRNLEAEGLFAELQQLIQLDAELRDAVTNVEIQAIESRLQAIEERVYQQLRALGRGKRDLREDILKRAEELLVIANASVIAFQADNRTNAAQLILRTERDLQQIVVELRAAANATNQTQVQELEGRALRAEFQLTDDLRRLGRPVDLKERRELLITAANALYQYATRQIALLKTRNNTIEISRIEAQEKAIGNLVAQLKNATLESDLNRLEEELVNAEVRLAEELQIAGQPVITRDELDRLLRAAEELTIRVIIAIRNLEGQGNTLLAEGLRLEEQHLIRLDVEIRTAVFPEEIARLEERLKEENAHITAALARIGS